MTKQDFILECAMRIMDSALQVAAQTGKDCLDKPEDFFAIADQMAKEADKLGLFEEKENTPRKKLELEDHNFRVKRDSTWKKIKEHGVNVYVNPEKDIWEFADGKYKGEQLFTWDAAIRETKKVGKRMPTDEELTELVKTKSDIKNPPCAGLRNTDNGHYQNCMYNGFLWSSTQSESYARIRVFDYRMDRVHRGYDTKTNGFSVRCVKE